MITIKILREALAEITSQIPEIKTVKKVSSDDRFTDKLSAHKTADNTLLVWVIPAYNGFGEEDNGGFYSHFQFFILDKIDYKTKEPEDTQEELQPIVQDFLKKLFAYSHSACELFTDVDRENIDIMSVTNKAGCAGWEIQISDKSFTGYDGRVGEE